MGAPLKRHDVIIIGGGQAGLALGHHLANQLRRFTILDAGDSPAPVWRSRGDSLTMFTPPATTTFPADCSREMPTTTRSAAVLGL